jgi:hypothetical protein
MLGRFTAVKTTLFQEAVDLQLSAFICGHYWRHLTNFVTVITQLLPLSSVHGNESSNCMVSLNAIDTTKKHVTVMNYIKLKVKNSVR